MLSSEMIITSQIMQIIYCIIGIPSNLLCAAVFCRTSMRSPYSGLVVGLAVCDNLILVGGLIGLTDVLGIGLGVDRGHVGMFFFRWIYGTGSRFFTLAIAAERCYVVYYPLHAHTTRETRGLWTTVLAAGSVGLAAVFGYIYSKYIQTGYSLYVAIVINTPFPLVVILSGALWLRVKQNDAKRAKMSSQEQKGGSATKMLLAVTVVFGGCCFLDFLRRMFHLTEVYYHQGPSNYYDYTLSHLADHFYLINSCINFIIYGAMSVRFRQEAKAMLTCRRESKTPNRIKLEQVSSTSTIASNTPVSK